KLPGLVNAPSKWLFTVDMFAQGEGLETNGRVHVVRRANDYPLDLAAHIIEHLAVIAKTLGPWVKLESRRSAALVHVAQGHDMLFGQRAQVVEPTAPTTDESELQFCGSGLRTRGRRWIRQPNEPGPNRPQACEGLTAIQFRERRLHRPLGGHFIPPR